MPETKNYIVFTPEDSSHIKIEVDKQTAEEIARIIEQRKFSIGVMIDAQITY